MPPYIVSAHTTEASSPEGRPVLVPLSPGGILFRLKLFGSACIIGPGGPVTGRSVQRRRIGLLALLALAGERGLTRARLIGYLWPDADAERARHALSDSVYRINQAVGGEALIAAGDELRLNGERLPSDAFDFVEAVERADWARAIELHVAPFLDGFFLTDADELERWVDAQRERLWRDRGRALEALARAAEERDDRVAAVRWWRALAADDPHSSRIALRLMRALEAAGERAPALRHADAHALLLKEEMELVPDPELLDYVAELRRSPRRAAPSLAGRPRDRSVAVRPFHNLSSDPENDYFADGITEDVIAHLARIRDLRVTSRTSTMALKARHEGRREMAESLGVATLLEGSVRRSGDRVRIVAQLIDAATEQSLWAETYDREIVDVFAIQTDVALQIASALDATLSPDEDTRIRREPTTDIAAYQFHLKGRHCVVRYTEEGLRQGILFFERAVERDPGYALGYASIAMAYAELAETGGLDPDAAYGLAQKAAATALSLDSGLADAHSVRGQLQVVCEFDWSGAEASFRRALELSPGNADTAALYGRMCASLERYDEALALERKAQELDPLAHRADVATTLLRAGRLQDALEAAERAVEFEPHYDRAWATLGWAHMMTGQEAAGIRELERAVSLSAGNTAWLAQLGQACAMAGRTDRAREILDQLQAMATERYVSPYHLAYLYTGLGEQELAIDHLERACRERAGGVYGIKGSFLFTTLRTHPRFTTLLRRMNLV